MFNKLFRLVSLLLLGILLVSIIPACNSTVRNPSTSSNNPPIEENCRSIKHAMGETCVPINPQRVVTLSIESLSNALVLGVKPIASATYTNLKDGFPSYLADKAEGIATLGVAEQPNVETILSLKPDLIIGLKRSHEAIYPLLENIAPTVLYEWRSDETWRDQFSFVTEVLGKQEAAQQAWDRYYQKIEELKLALGIGIAFPKENRYQDRTVSFVYYYFGRFGSDVKNSFAGSILEDIGLQRPESQNIIAPYGSIEFSEEAINKADGDFLFITTFTDSDEESLQQLIQKPLWKQLKAVQQNHVYFVDSSTWVGWNLFAADAVIDDLFKHLVDTP